MTPAAETLSDLAWHETHLHYVRMAELNANDRRRQTIATANLMLEQLHEQVRTLETSRTALAAERDDLAQRLQALQQSTSWRLTAPLRRVLTSAPGVARLARKIVAAAWWAITLQLHTRIGLWLQHRRRKDR